MAEVIAFVHKSDAAFGVSFPDFPGAIAGGETMSDALNRARSALAVHVAAMLDDGEPLPVIRDFDSLKPDMAEVKHDDDFVAVAALTLDLPGKPLRLNVSIDENLVARIDRKADELGETRSGFLAAAARQRLATV